MQGNGIRQMNVADKAQIKTYIQVMVKNTSIGKRVGIKSALYAYVDVLSVGNTNE
ncbi:hypothetical protein JCM15548_11469 [Geofilum rubicundum JCM 15548]|uniref:Uncharacterized protein n=1 Tax=Geofilum rubicundum JCM 15548 TaxID=1236989 RepID=A0A0E9LWP2_9BACT|nr:hypothetical protein JCM15548_11469 [Geofilum rubicundum JCM 15548]